LIKKGIDPTQVAEKATQENELLQRFRALS
jgi:hypothetical protein